MKIIFPVRTRLLELIQTLSLKLKVTLFTLLLFIITVGVLTYQFMAHLRSELEISLSEQQFSEVSFVAERIDNAVKLRIDSLALIANSITPEMLVNHEKLIAFLAERKAIYKLCTLGVIVIDKKGQGLADYPKAEGRGSAVFTDRDFFREVIATEKPSISKPGRGRFVKDPRLVIAVPIFSAQKKLLGVFAGVVSLSNDSLLADFDIDSHPNTSGYLVISPRDNLFVAATDKSHILQPLPAPGVNKMLDRYLKGFEGSGIAVNAKGINELSSAKRIKSANWIVAGVMPTEQAFYQINHIRSQSILVAILLCLLVLPLLWFFLRRQLTSLQHSIELIQAQSLKKMIEPIPLEGCTEIRQMQTSFNQLQSRIQQDQESLRLSAKVFQSSSEAIVITDAQNRILAVNPAFTQITQYQLEEVLGRDPKLLSSGSQGVEFYRTMWQSILTTGKWSGEILNRRKNGEIYTEWLNISTVYDEDHQPQQRIAIFSDISEKKRNENLIWEQANYDALTGLPNRRLFHDRLEQEIKKAEREHNLLALMFIDLDRFKEVNDTLGHEAGDILLKEAAARISHCVRDTDTLARLGGDEFTVILPGMADTDRLEIIANQIIQTLALPFAIGEASVYVSASIGITIFPNDAAELSSLLKNADQAMYVAKNKGRNQFRYFTASMQEAAHTRLQLSTDLRIALQAEQLEVYYQPIIDLQSGEVTKAEALIRWHHPVLGMVSPAIFIPLAEDIGLINAIGDWVFQQSALQALHWNLNKASHLPNIQISVNKSPRQFVAGQNNLDIVEWLHKLALPPNCIVMEITEGLLMDDRSEVKETLLAYRDAGIQVSLDDFGTGYSAMSYLQRFDIDYIKVDQSFVRNMTNSAGDVAIVEAIIVMAHKLGMKVIAEGVETQQQREMLMAAGCDYGQGYLFARPMPAREFNWFLRLPN
jgi:diguanylate cyclase (GGDEF)-like protein/PAS domain S-box-containing protein